MNRVPRMWARAAALCFATHVCVGYTAGQTAVPARAEIPARYRWDLSQSYADQAAWEADFARAQREVQELAASKVAAFENPEALRRLLMLRDDTRWRVDKLVVHASQLCDQDTRDNAAVALKNRAAALYVAYGKAVAWIEPALQATPEEQVQAWCRADKQLGVYRHYFDNVLRGKPHTLPAREEELLALSGSLAANPEETFSTLLNSELRWPSIEDEEHQATQLSPARFDKFQRSTDRRVRKDAFFGGMSAYAQFQNTFASTFNGAVQRNLLYARARGFDSALDSVLFPDNLPAAVYANLVETTQRHLSLLHRWAALRKQTLGVDELHVYDLYQPLATGGAAEIKYDDAVVLITAALQPLGPEYCTVVQQGFASRWVDVYETQGKRAGGYSWGSYDTPPYILVNYNGTPRDMSILAHELGHSLHSYFTHKTQPKAYGDYSGSVAEVASILNELLLEEYRLAHAATPAEKLRLVNEQIDNLTGTTFRQVLFAEFEYEAHALVQRGEAITAQRLGQLYLDTFHKYWGPDVARDAEHAVYWARIPHFYMNHYVFRYALAYCAAAALAENVLAEQPDARDAYLTLLRSGSSDYPLELLRKAGVDLTTPAPIEATMRRLERLLGEFEQLQAAPG